MFVALQRVEHVIAQRQTGWFAWLVVCIVWGLTYQWIALGDTWAPLLFTALRYSLAGAILLLLSDPADRAAVFRTRSFWRLTLAGCLMFVTGNGILVWALQSSERVRPDPGIVAVMIAMIPVYTSALASMKKPGSWHMATWAGLLLGLTGVGVSHMFGGQIRQHAYPTPHVPLYLPDSALLVLVALQLGCISWSAGSLYASGVSHRVPPLVVAGTQMLTAGAVLLLLAFVHGDPFLAPWPEPGVLAALVGVTIVGSVIGYFCYALALRHLAVSTVSLHAYVNPMVAMAVAAVVEQRGYAIGDIAATLLVLAGVALALYADGSQAHPVADCATERAVRV